MNSSRANLALALLLAAYAALLVVFSLTRYYEFKSSIFDLSTYVQSLWAFLHEGTFLMTATPPFTEQHAFAQHFTPFFYFLVPLYALAPHPETLQILYALCFALAAWPIFLSVRALGFSPPHALLLVVAFLANPFLLNAALWDFHEAGFATLCMSGALWAIVTRRRRAMLLFALLLLMCKEHFGIAVAGMGVLWARETGERKLGATMAAVGLLTAWIVITQVMPAYHPEHMHPMIGVDRPGANRFGWLLDPLHHTDLIAALVVANLFYGFFLLAPLLGLPLRAPWWLLPAAADLLVNGSSASGFLRSVHAYHSAPVIPVLIIAAAHGTRSLLAKPQRFTRNDVMALVAAFSLMMGWSLAPLPLPGAVNMWEIGSPRLGFPADDRQALGEIGALVTPENKIAAQSNVGALFAQRHFLYPFPQVRQNIDTIILRTEFPFTRSRSVFSNPLGVEPDALVGAYRDMLAQGWGIVYWRKPWLVLRKNPAHPIRVEAEVEKAWGEFLAHYQAIPQKGGF